MPDALEAQGAEVGHREMDPSLVEIARRSLADGTEWRVVKVMHEPDALNRLLEAEGWRSQVDATRWFIFGSAEPAR